MTSHIQNINDMPLDILGLVEEQVKEQRCKNYWKSKLNETIKDIEEQGIHLVVYLYEDGCGTKDCPYFIWEFNCCCDDDEYGSDL